MKRIVLCLMLLSVVMIKAQNTSRLMLGLGGGLSINATEGKAENICGPLGTLNVGYAITNNVNSDVKLGFRTGLNIAYSKFGNALYLKESFTNINYYGNSMDYTVTSTRVVYKQQQFNLELPIMFALHSKCVYINVGTKFVLPLWNRYIQSIENPQIAVSFPDYGVTVVDDIITGVVNENQKMTSGKASIPSLMVGLSAEIGYVWQLNGSNNKLGFDIFVDYIPWNIGFNKNGKSIVEVAPIINDGEQPKAIVTVNPMNQCYDYTYNVFNFGAKLVYMFDIEHHKVSITK